jgi:imidazolonepropionase-like amidohydrolase
MSSIRLNSIRIIALVAVLLAHLACAGHAWAQVAVRARVLHTMEGDGAGTIRDGVVVITDGKIARVGPAASTPIPAGYRVIDAPVATPGFIDGRCTVGVSGMLNQRQDQDQLERSGAMQPELRAIDAFNPLDPLVAYVRMLGVTTLHTGHAPGELISGQTCVVKATGAPVDACVVVETAGVAVTLGPGGHRSGGSPGTRAKAIAMLRDELLKAQEHVRKEAAREAKAGETPAEGAPTAKPPEARNLRREIMARVIRREVPLVVTAHRAQDIHSALRLAREFDVRVILDGASEAYLLADEIARAGVDVLVHPTMARAYGEMENMTWENASRLADAGVRVAFQGGYESYVPKARVVHFEAGVAAAHGLGFERALRAITVDSAAILGLEGRLGRLAPGLDADVALFDGDPFEYRTKCLGVIIDGRVFEGPAR